MGEGWVTKQPSKLQLLSPHAHKIPKCCTEFHITAAAGCTGRAHAAPPACC